MNFIKTTHQCEDRYFFEDRPGHKCSPYFHTLDGAEHWRSYELTRQYKGKERRRSLTDRRTDRQRLKDMVAPIWPYTSMSGRREADQPLVVDVDRTEDHLERLLEWTRDRGI